jgi:hypothetical protein
MVCGYHLTDLLEYLIAPSSVSGDGRWFRLDSLSKNKQPTEKSLRGRFYAGELAATIRGLRQSKGFGPNETKTEKEPCQRQLRL